jgi:hypothetical protein
MPKRCSVCSHRDRQAIDSGLIAGTPFRELATRFRLSSSALFRHRNTCLRSQLADARETEMLTSAATLEDQVSEIQQIIRRVIAAAEADAKPSTILAGVQKLQSSIEFLAKLPGKLGRDRQAGVVVPTVDDDTLEKIARAFLLSREEDKRDPNK